MTWQPIETAPKDEPILITRFAPGTQWHGRMAVDVKSAGRGFGCFNQWYPPTHWQPLPELPDQSQ